MRQKSCVEDTCRCAVAQAMAHRGLPIATWELLSIGLFPIGAANRHPYDDLASDLTGGLLPLCRQETEHAEQPGSNQGEA